MTLKNIYYNVINIFLLYIFMNVLDNWQKLQELQELQNPHYIRMDVLEVIKEWFTELTEIWKWFINSITIDVNDILTQENDLLVRWLYLLNWIKDIPFEDFIDELNLINISTKYDISNEIKYIKDDSNEDSKCYLKFSVAYWDPYCVIFYQDKKWQVKNIKVNFSPKNSN